MRTQADHAEYDWHAGPSDDQIAAEMEADRCQQLAALEAEIGRAVIGAGVIFHSINPAIDALIARWRKLHAQGAEAEAATERQEGER